MKQFTEVVVNSEKQLKEFLKKHTSFPSIKLIIINYPIKFPVFS
jgi:hypothetical protein